MANMDWFVKARFGLFVHYGIYSMLERGEWVLNRDRIDLDGYKKLAMKFNPEKFDADFICNLAVDAGMRYINLTTMHHDGFRLYDTRLTDFNSVKVCGRDLVAETVEAARKHGLKVSLYHSLNNWMDQPDAVAALESKDAYEQFIANTFARLEELATIFNPIDVMWYDGWWPFHADGWQAEKMNEIVRKIQPHIIFNGRNALPGDFATPEGHMSAPNPWRPWEGCITFNEHWGYHRGDNEWKSPEQIIGLLATAAQNKGNLLFNIGPKGDGSVPQASVDILRTVGKWVKKNEECLFDTDLFIYGLEKREEHHRGDFNANGPFIAKGNNLYQIVRYWPGPELIVAGLKCKVQKAALIGGRELNFRQEGERVIVSGLPESPPDLCPVIRFECDQAPEIYLTGGMRIPNVPHPPYDPAASDIML